MILAILCGLLTFLLFARVGERVYNRRKASEDLSGTLGDALASLQAIAAPSGPGVITTAPLAIAAFNRGMPFPTPLVPPQFTPITQPTPDLASAAHCAAQAEAAAQGRPSFLPPNRGT